MSTGGEFTYLKGVKKFLVPIDFTATSRNALSHLIAFLQDCEKPSKIYMLHAYLVPPVAMDEIVQANDELKKESLEKLNEEMIEAKKRDKSGRITFEVLSHMGTQSHLLAYLVKDLRINWVVLSSEKEKAKESLLRIISQGACGVMAIPYPV